MKFTDIQSEILQIVQDKEGRFISAYQVCNQLEAMYPQQWEQLKKDYPSQEGCPEMGAGACSHYSPANFVALALEHFHKGGTPLQKEFFVCENVIFNGVKPGYTGNWVSIWAWRG